MAGLKFSCFLTKPNSKPWLNSGLEWLVWDRLNYTSEFRINVAYYTVTVVDIIHFLTAQKDRRKRKSVCPTSLLTLHDATV